METFNHSQPVWLNLSAKFPYFSYLRLCMWAELVFLLTLSSTHGAVFTVLNTNSSGAASLNEAITSANLNPGQDTVRFALPAGATTISPAGPLPVITDPLIIDGASQPGFTNWPLVELSGSGAGAGADGLTIFSSNCVVRSLVINRFLGNGLAIISNGNSSVEGCLIGTGAFGTNDLGNGLNGILITNSVGNRVGGLLPGQGNIISGNNQNGLLIGGPGSWSNSVFGNVVGLSANGSNAVANNASGILILNAGRNQVGTTNEAGRNIVSGNNQNGVRIEGANAFSNAVVGNYIGLTVTGEAKRGNLNRGIHILNAASNLIGGTVAQARNSISGNGTGLVLDGPTATANLVLGNYVGTSASGTNRLGNTSDGIQITTGAHDNVIGSPNSASGNLVAYNGAVGVNVGNGNNNSIRGNSIFQNTTLGIDLSPNGVTANDSMDDDSGANALQNFPVLLSATNNGLSTSIQLSLNSKPSTAYWLDFYSSPACDPNGHGEGEVFLGSETVSTDSDGNFSGTLTLPGNLPYHFLTATATDPSGNTSEFSSCRQAYGTLPGIIYSVTNTNDSGPGSLRQAMLDANASLTAGDTIIFNIPGPAPYMISPSSALPTIVDRLSVDATTQPGFAGVPVVFLDGKNAGAGVGGLRLNASDSLIRGLGIYGFSGDGIQIVTNGNCVVEACYLGIRPGEPVAPGNANGISITYSAGNRIGGASSSAGNLISGHPGNGILIQGTGSSNNVVLGNRIGTIPSGKSFGNERGIHLLNCSENVIGSATSNAGNLVLNSHSCGVYLEGTSCFRNLLQGNRIGSLPQSQKPVYPPVGIFLSAGANHNAIGSSSSGSQNIISGNNIGIAMNGPAGTNAIAGNFIGFDPDGILDTTNHSMGISLSNSSFNAIGGANSGEGNQIAFSIDDGIWVYRGTNNQLLGNQIFRNGQLGIDLASTINPKDGVTTNDVDDLDSVGGNLLQNFPIITGATLTNQATFVQGVLNSSLNSSFTLEFFNNAVCHSSGYGEGETFLGRQQVVTDSKGNARFNLLLPAAQLGSVITATATDANGNTSEFSPCATVIPCAPNQPRLVAFGNSSGIQLFWPAASGWFLQTTTNVSPPVVWTTITNATSGLAITNNGSNPARFFRLVCP